MPATGPDVRGLDVPGAPPTRLVFTCEHGGNQVPARYRPLFTGHEALLDSHRGYDPGALALARDLARAFEAPLVAATTSRLLVELNRSPHHPRLFSEVLRAASPELRAELVARYYLPYRTRTERLIAGAILRGRQVIHISSHSFTPVLDTMARNTDIGLLYDPARPGERALCLRWQAALARHAPRRKVRRNYPYTGKSDGFCAWLRRRFGPADYIGIELEINQKFVLAGGREWGALRRAVVAALADALGG